MKLEKFSFSEKKAGKWFLYGFVLCAILMVVVNLFTSKAKYRTTESIPLVRGKISYKMPDLNVVAMYQKNESGEYESVDAVPSSKYTLNTTESYCEVNKVKDTSITMEYESGLVNFNGISKKGTKCYLYFDVILGNTMSEILAGYIQSTRIDFSTVLTAASTGTVYSAEDDLGTSLYFAGAPTDNWVSFGGYFWRIIRMNGDGSTRLIYQGTTANTTGTETQIGTKAFNSSSNNNAYVGYMYTLNSLRGLGTSSTIKSELDTWYSTNLNKTGVAEYIDRNVGFCGDRTPSTSNSTSNGSGGTGTTVTYYGDYIRFWNSGTPTLKCANSSDLYTTSGSNRGNKALSNPIGLINMNEVWLAGGYQANNTSYYLYTGQTYWTMSPSFSDGIASVFRVYSDGNLNNDFHVGDTDGVRPVINLKANTQFIGDGTAYNPYQLSVE